MIDNNNESTLVRIVRPRRDENKTGDFRKELQHLLNRMSMENESDTPDFMLAEYLTDCLQAYERVIRRREIWYGRK